MARRHGKRQVIKISSLRFFTGGPHTGARPKKEGARTPSLCFFRETAKPLLENTKQEAAPVMSAFSSVSLPKMKISGFRKKRFCTLTQNYFVRYLSCLPHCVFAAPCRLVKIIIDKKLLFNRRGHASTGIGVNKHLHGWQCAKSGKTCQAQFENMFFCSECSRPGAVSWRMGGKTPFDGTPILSRGISCSRKPSSYAKASEDK